MASVDIGENSYQTFADVDFANQFLAGDVARATGWALRNDDAKGRGLVSATRLLSRLPWIDPAPTLAAAPVLVKEITAMLAEDLLAEPDLFNDASGNSNVKSVKAGSASVEFFRPVEDGPAIPRAFWDLLIAAGLVSYGTSSVTDGAIVTGIYAGRRPLYGRPTWDYPIAALDHD